MSKSAYQAQQILVALATGHYLGLFTRAPLPDSSGGVEMSGNAYARIAFSGSTPSAWPVKIYNTADLIFPTSTPGAQGPARAWGLFDAASGGHLLYWGLLVTPTALVGQVTLTNGAATITGIGTLFLTGTYPLFAGAEIWLDADGAHYAGVVTSVESDTAATLTSNYLGTGGSGIAVFAQFPNITATKAGKLVTPTGIVITEG